MSPLRFFLLAITFLLTFTLFLPAFGQPTPSTLRAEEQELSQSTSEGRLEQKRLDLEVQKLKLEVEELRKPWWHKVGHLVPVIVPSVTLLVLGVGAFWTIFDGRKRRRLETVTNRKREFASDNPAIRIAAVRALADYPKEAIPTLIASLGSTKPAQTVFLGSTPCGPPEEDTAFTSAVKDSLRQIGKEAVYPLIKELRRIQGEIRNTLISGENAKVKRLYQPLPSLPFTIFNEGSGAVQKKLKEVAGCKSINLDDEEIKRAVERLEGIRSSRPEALLANKNGAETLADLLRTHRIKCLNLYGIDLSGAYLGGANLLGTLWMDANLSGAFLMGTNLSDAGLWDANLSGADLGGANLLGAYLSRANLSGAYLEGVKGFREVRDFSGADLMGVKGLSREDLEYAKEKGAMIDEPAADKPKEPPPKADGQP